ncbi:MAG: hypothetical protein ACTS7I_01985 [Candidatus Hodgkinia cicadicola]
MNERTLVLLAPLHQRCGPLAFVNLPQVVSSVWLRSTLRSWTRLANSSLRA